MPDLVAVRPPLRHVDWHAHSTDVGWANDGLGRGWIDGHTALPTSYEPLGVRDTPSGRAVVVTDPTSRGGEYTDDPTAGIYPPADGKILPGIGCAWRRTAIDAPTVKIDWAGWNVTGTHVEAGALIHVTPGTEELGVGAWVTRVLGQSMVILCSITDPPEMLGPNVYDLGHIPHTAGTRRTIEVRSDGEALTAWVDGTQVSMQTNGLDPIPVPAALLGSTMHGFAVDAHLTPVAQIPSTPAIYSWSIDPT